MMKKKINKSVKKVKIQCSVLTETDNIIIIMFVSKTNLIFIYPDMYDIILIKIVLTFIRVYVK